MEFNTSFTAPELKSWLERNSFESETTERITADFLDGDDLCGIFQDDQELRHYFPIFKERMSFKNLVRKIIEDEMESRRPLSHTRSELLSRVPGSNGRSSPCSTSSTSSLSISPTPKSSDDDLSSRSSRSCSSSNSCTPLESPLLSSTPKSKAGTSNNLETGNKSSNANVVATEATKKTKVPGWMSKIQLPSRFSASVEVGLHAGKLSNNLQNELVRDVCTAMQKYTSHPSKEERVQVAKILIAKYPCMADQKILDTSTEWGSLEVKIFNRMKKLQKPKRNAASSACSSGTCSKPKRKRLAENCWSEPPDVPEGETLESLRKYINQKRPELIKKPTNVKLHKDTMDHTFALRRYDILERPSPVKDVLADYPSLRKFVHLKGELCRIFGSDDIPADVRSKYQTWQGKILKHAETCKNREMEKVVEGMLAAISEEGSDRTEIEHITAFVLLNKLLKQKNGKKKGIQEEVFTLLKRDSDVEKEIEPFVQPQVVGVGELYDLDLLYIVCEGSILCSIPQQRILDAILCLLASFYIFNISYKEGKGTLSFLEQTLLGVGRGQTIVSVSAIINTIADL